MDIRKAILVFTIISLISFLVRAHEFWMEANRFYFRAGEEARIQFRIGDDFIGEEWKVKGDRVVRMEHHSAQQVKNIKSPPGGNTEDPFQIPLVSEGAHVIAMETNTAFIKLDGIKFTEYLEEDGLDEVLNQRRKEGISGDSASEFYSRHAKLILQAGSRTDDTYKKVFHLPIEIIPEQNPSLQKKGDRIGFKILFQGKPLFGAKVKVWNRYNHHTSVN